MKWLILAIFAEVSVLLCLIYTFDGALHSLSTARLTWDHAAVAIVYTYVRGEFSRRRVRVGSGHSPLPTQHSPLS